MMIIHGFPRQFPAFIIGLFCAISFIHGVESANLVFPKSLNILKRNNIDNFSGCDGDVGKNSVNGRDFIKTTYNDMLKMTQYAETYIDRDPLTIEKRYFGSTFGSFPGRLSKVRHVFHKAASHYPWFFFDWIWGSSIEVFCAVDQPNDRNMKCSGIVDDQNIVAYAISEQGKSQIVFCDSFFGIPTVAQVHDQLEQTPDYQKDVTKWKSSGAQFFHEMTHLKLIEGGGFGHIDDQRLDAPDNTGILAYSAKQTERLASKFPGYAVLNADNYAWYLTSIWFAQYYGTPPSALQSTADEPAVNLLGDSNSADGSDPTVGYDNPGYDRISAEEAVAVQNGQYTPDGWISGRKLRILPIGDSITWGYQSSDGNGYRDTLLQILQNANNNVEYVGSVRSGDMPNNQNEGHPGWTISRIANATLAYASRPNIILLHAGTNDLNIPDRPGTAPQRLDALVDQLLAALPDATVIVARIIPSTNSGTSVRVPVFNNAVTRLMAVRVKAGERVVVVDMPSAVAAGELVDRLHPSDQGYGDMALEWATGLTAADELGWIEDPVAVAGQR